MNADRSFDTLLAGWLTDATSEAGAELVHERAMTDVRGSRPRPAWLVVVSGGAMGGVARRLDRVGRAGRTSAYMLVVLALALVLVAAAIVGSRLIPVELPPPYGPAENGLLSFSTDGDIWVTDPDGTNQRVLIDDQAEDGWPLYSPDGTRFIFDRTLPDGHHQVMVADADGRNPPTQVAVVPEPLEDWTWTDWAPDSESLVVMWAGIGRRELAILHTNGDPPTPVDIGDLVPVEVASWRPPDGQEIIFEASAGGLGLRGIYAIRPDGTGARPIGDVGNDCRDCLFQQPALSPDGRMMAFSNFETSPAGVQGNFLHERDLDTGTDSLIPLDPLWALGAMLPRYSPDARSVVFETLPHDADPGLDGQLVIAPLDGSAPGVALGPAYASGDRESFDISPDGKTVILDLAGVTWFIDTATGIAKEAPDYMPNQPSWQRR